MILFVGGLYSLAAYLVWFERAYDVYVTNRELPSWNGYQALFRPLYDGFFVFLQWSSVSTVESTFESTFRTRVGPILYLALATFAFVTIPFGYVLPFSTDSDPIVLTIAAGMDLGLLVTLATFALTALYLATLGIGIDNLARGERWFANQLPMGLSLFGILTLCGSARLETIILKQAASGVWWVAVQPLGCTIFIGAALAAPARRRLHPCSQNDSEVEIQSGNHFQVRPYELAEYLQVIAVSYLFVIVFFGGWHLWWLAPAAEPEDVTILGAMTRFAVLHVKVGLVVVGVIWLRCYLPSRPTHRVSEKLQTMLVPLGTVNLLLTAGWQAFGSQSYGVLAAISWSLLALWLIFVALVDHRHSLTAT